MEDYIDIIIYGIIAIIGLVSSAMNKKRKQERESQNIPVFEEEEEVIPKTSDGYFFSDFLESITPETEVKEQIEEEEQPTEITAATVEDEIELVKEEPKIESEFNPIYDSQIGNNEEKDIEFDLEKAVIYSALLQTKHF